MFAQLGVWITTFLNGYVASVVGTLATALTPLALIWLTVYIANYGYSVTRGEAHEPFTTFAWKMVKMAFILGFALSSARFMDVIFTTADGIQDGMATIFIQSPDYDSSAPATVFTALDSANDRANELLKEIWKDASMWRLDLVVASIFFALGSAIFMVLGTFVALLSKVVLAFVMAIGPICILTLMFKPTAKFFDAWLSTAMSAIVLAWFVFFALGLSFFVVNMLLNTMTAAGAFSAAGLVNAIESSVTYLIFMLLLGILLYQAPQLASALTGGASVHTGGQVLAAGLAAQRLFGGANRGGATAGGGGGGSMSRGTGLSYGVGQATAATASGSLAAGRVAVNAGIAAYQRVARRGNRS